MEIAEVRMVTKVRPWFGTESASSLKAGTRIEVKWGSGFTSAHTLEIKGKTPGFHFTHQDTKIWVPLSSVQFRSIPEYKPNRPGYARFGVPPIKN